MPTRPLSDELAQQALDVYEQFGDYVTAAKSLGVAKQTFRDRVKNAQVRGMRPTVRKDAPRVYQRQRLGRMHVVIPDVQARLGVKLDHLDWIGGYIAEKRPDVIVNIGDFADIEGLNSYDKGTLRGENKRLKKDLIVASDAMERLVSKWRDIPDYKPEMHLTMGNHEERLDRFANENPCLDEIIGTHMLNYESWGWEVHPYLKPVTVDGVSYCHFFVAGESGRPVSSARALLNRRTRSSIMGHNQKTDIAFQPVTHQWAIFCGLCNLHDEHYLGAQGNVVRRQILVLYEVEDGRFDPAFISLKFLEKNYG
jgi:hypothetical protein